MTAGERGRAKRVLLWALLCAGGAAVPVLTSRAPGTEDLPRDVPPAVASAAPPPYAPAVRPRLSPLPFAPAFRPSLPPPPSAPALPPPTLEDRLRSLVVG